MDARISPNIICPQCGCLMSKINKKQIKANDVDKMIYEYVECNNKNCDLKKYKFQYIPNMIKLETID